MEEYKHHEAIESLKVRIWEINTILIPSHSNMSDVVRCKGIIKKIESSIEVLKADV